MYLPEAFREEDFAEIAEILRRHPLGALVTQRGGVLTADHIPFLFDAQSRILRAHVARANPLWRKADPGQEVLAIFAGLQRYVTPSWYATKRKTGKVVPTWNYEVVHIHGHLRAVDDAKAAREVVDALTREHERERAAPWAVGDAPQDFIEARLEAIVAIEIAITRVEAKRKLSQNQNEEDRAGVIAGLRAEGDGEAQEMARRMAREAED